MNPLLSDRLTQTIMAVALIVAGCTDPGPSTTQIDFSQRVHRDVVGDPDPTSPAVTLNHGHLEIKLTDTETITIFGQNNHIQFHFIDPDKRPKDELRALWTNEIDFISAQTAGHTAEETKILLRERVELANQTVDWETIDEWIDGKANPDTFEDFSQTSLVVDERVGDDGWNLRISLVGRGPDNITIRSNLSPRFETATKDLTPEERISVSFNPNFTRAEDLE